MNRHRLVGTLALAFGVISMSAVPAWARQEGARPNSSGSSTGTATSRGGDSGGSATSSGGSSSSSSGSGGVSSPTSSMGSSSTPSAWSSYEAPSRSNDAPSRSNDQGARTRSGSSTSSGERAVSRSGGGETNAPRGGRTASSTGSSDSSAPTRTAVPTYARPRDGRPVIGTATDRGSIPPPPNGGGGGIIYYPYYPYGFWGPGYGYGLGFMFYDPFWYGGYDPFGYSGYYGGGGGGGYGGYSVSRSYPETGSLRLKINPKKAQVYVDGYYVGLVDDFDGAFQKLSLDSGNHRVEVKADGFQAADFEVLIAPGQTVTYKGELKEK